MTFGKSTTTLAAILALSACGGSEQSGSKDSDLQNGAAGEPLSTDGLPDPDDEDRAADGTPNEGTEVENPANAPDGGVPLEEARLQISCGVRNLKLAWSAIEGATEYEIEQSIDGGLTYSSFTPRLTERTFETEISVHLTDWQETQFRIQACNGTDCSASAAFEASHVGVDCVGFVKPQVPKENADFGGSIAMNGLGTAFAVGAPGQDGGTGAVVLFEKDETGQWQEMQTLVGPHPESSFGYSVSMDDSGQMLVVGVPDEQTLAAGIDPPASSEVAASVGAVFVYEKGPEGFTLSHVLKASNAEYDDEFGTSVSVSCDGTRIAVGAPSEDGSSPLINGDEASNGDSRSGAAYIFQQTDGAWTQQAYVKSTNLRQLEDFGTAVDLSCDGLVLAVGAPGDNTIGAGVLPASGNHEKSNSLNPPGAAHVFRLVESDWTPEVIIRQDVPERFTGFGHSLSLSGDGSWLAVGRRTTGDEATHGAASLYSNDGVLWISEGVVPARTSYAGSLLGRSVKLSRDASILVSAATGDHSSGNGVGPIDVDGNDSSGTIFGFVRTEAGFVPAFTAKEKVPGYSSFGSSLAISADGGLLAVGAPGESSTITGVSTVASTGTGANDSGAVYLF